METMNEKEKNPNVFSRKDDINFTN